MLHFFGNFKGYTCKTFGTIDKIRSNNDKPPQNPQKRPTRRAGISGGFFVVSRRKYRPARLQKNKKNFWNAFFDVFLYDRTKEENPHRKPRRAAGDIAKLESHAQHKNPRHIRDAKPSGHLDRVPQPPTVSAGNRTKPTQHRRRPAPDPKAKKPEGQRVDSALFQWIYC